MVLSTIFWDIRGVIWALTRNLKQVLPHLALFLPVNFIGNRAQFVLWDKVKGFAFGANYLFLDGWGEEKHIHGLVYPNLDRVEPLSSLFWILYFAFVKKML